MKEKQLTTSVLVNSCALFYSKGRQLFPEEAGDNANVYGTSRGIVKPYWLI